MKKRFWLQTSIALIVSAIAIFGCKAANVKEQDIQTLNLGDISTVGKWGKAIKSSDNKKKITVGMATHPSTNAMRKMAQEFTDLTGIEVIWDIVEETNLKTKQVLDSQGRGSYDILMVDAFWINEYAAKKILEPLDSYLTNTGITPPWFDYEDIMPAYRNGISAAKNIHYGIPIAGETRFIAYRTDLFTKYNQSPPQTMEEFLALARFFNGKEPNLYGVAMRGQRGIHFASGWMSLMYNFGAGFIDQGTIGNISPTVTINTPETISSLQFYVDLLKNAPPDVGSYTHEEALGAFVSGKTAMWLDATALANEITNPDVSKVSDKVAFVPTPTGPAGDGAALAGWSLGIAKKSKNKQAAWAFITYMTSREMSLKYVNLGGIPTRSSAFRDKTLREKYPSFEAQEAALRSANNLVEKGITWIPQVPEITQILEIAGAYGASVLAGDIPIHEAAIKAQKEVEDILTSTK